MKAFSNCGKEIKNFKLSHRDCEREKINNRHGDEVFAYTF